MRTVEYKKKKKTCHTSTRAYIWNVDIAYQSFSQNAVLAQWDIFRDVFANVIWWSLFVQKYNICWALIIKFCTSKSANYFAFDKHPIWTWFIDKLKKATVTMSNPMHKMHLNNIYNQLANLCWIVALLSAVSGIKICKSFADADRVLFTVQGSTDMHGVNSFVQTKTNVAVSKMT